MVSAWRNFKNIFSRPLLTIVFMPEMLKFHPYSILTGDTMVEFVIFCVLNLFYFNQICYEFQVCPVPLAAVTCRVPQVGPKCTTQTSTTLHPNMGTWAWPECTLHLRRCTPRAALRVIMGIRQEPLFIGLMGRRCQSRGLQGVPVEKICLLILQVCILLIELLQNTLQKILI